MAVATFDRVAERAAALKPARVALSVVASPFYLLGLVLGVAWLLIAWAYAAVLVGVADGRTRRQAGDADGVS